MVFDSSYTDNKIGLFLFLSGIVISLIGVVFAISVKLTRYSGNIEVITTFSLLATALVLFISGINLTLINQNDEKYLTIVGIVLSIGSVIYFILYYPENWLYPRIVYIILGYLSGIYLISGRLFYKITSIPNPHLNSIHSFYYDHIKNVSDNELYDKSDVPFEDNNRNNGDYEINKNSISTKFNKQGKNEEVDNMNETTSDEDVSVLNSDVSQIPKKKKAPEISKNDPMSEAAHKILSLHFKKMLKHETGTRIGKNNEELHDMRVAAMRMRSAFKVFNDYLDMDTLNKPLKKIKRTRKKLGSVRDLDVFMEKIENYLNNLPDERKSELDPLIDTLNVERDKSRGNMLVYLESNKYHKFVKNFINLLEDDDVWKMPQFSDDGKPVPYKVKDVLPVLLHQQLATVRAYDEWVTGDDTSYQRLHQLRIDIKTLRYTLEFFNGVLGPETKSLIKDLKSMQDHLGELHDTVVAIELLEDFLKHGTWGESGLSIVDTNTSLLGVESYLEFRNKELNNLVDTFPEAWNNLMSPEFSNRFSSAITKLYNNNAIPNDVEEN